MERGPMALFGAIVAVGLGPALWLGAQFGNVSVPPSAPPAVVGEQRVVTGAPGKGAGAPPVEPVAEPTRRSGYQPLSSTPSARPSRSAEPPADQPAEEPTTPPAEETSDPAPSDAPTTPPVEESTEPAGPPAGEGDGDEEPGDPVPPAPDDPGGDTAGVTLAGR